MSRPEMPRPILAWVRGMTSTRLLLGTVLLLVAACGPGRDRNAPLDVDTSSGAAERVLDAVRLDSTITRDLTGDGAPERLVARARGPRIDSLAIELEIFDGRTGARIHDARWSSRDYFKYEPVDARADSTTERERIVRRHFDRILAPDAFVPPSMTLPGGRKEIALDTGTVRYALLELDWRRAHGLADTMPIPPEVESQLGRERVVPPEERARTKAVADELRGRPTFTLFQGGELTNTIAWSDREHAFVRVFSCC